MIYFLDPLSSCQEAGTGLCGGAACDGGSPGFAGAELCAGVPHTRPTPLQRGDIAPGFLSGKAFPGAVCFRYSAFSIDVWSSSEAPDAVQHHQSCCRKITVFGDSENWRLIETSRRASVAENCPQTCGKGCALETANSCAPSRPGLLPGEPALPPRSSLDSRANAERRSGFLLQCTGGICAVFQ